MTVHIQNAYLCPDCDCIGDDANQCHACANRCGLMNLAAVLDRDVIAIEAKAVFAAVSATMKERPFAIR